MILMILFGADNLYSSPSCHTYLVEGLLHVEQDHCDILLLVVAHGHFVDDLRHLQGSGVLGPKPGLFRPWLNVWRQM